MLTVTSLEITDQTKIMGENICMESDQASGDKRRETRKEEKHSKKIRLSDASEEHCDSGLTEKDSSVIEVQSELTESDTPRKNKHKKHKKSSKDITESDSLGDVSNVEVDAGDSSQVAQSELSESDKQRKKKCKKDKKSSKDNIESTNGVILSNAENDSEAANSVKHKVKKLKQEKKSHTDVNGDNESDADINKGQDDSSPKHVDSNKTNKSKGKSGKKNMTKPNSLNKDANKIQEDDPEEDPEKAAIRKKKREKRAQKKLDKIQDKQAREARAGTGKSSAIEYLNQWDKNRAEWKFMKVRQVWLLQNMFDTEQISDDVFEILLRYLKPLSGNAKTATLKSAEDIFKQAEEDTSEDGELANKAGRARHIIQLLSD